MRSYRNSGDTVDNEMYVLFFGFHFVRRFFFFGISFFRSEMFLLLLNSRQVVSVRRKSFPEYSPFTWTKNHAKKTVFEKYCVNKESKSRLIYI